VILELMSSFNSSGALERNLRSRSTWRDKEQPPTKWQPGFNTVTEIRSRNMATSARPTAVLSRSTCAIGRLGTRWGDWVRGLSDAVTYANNLNRYVEKMKAIDPSIKIIAVGDNNLDWNRSVLKIAGRNTSRGFFPLLAYPPKTYIGAAPGNRLLRLHLRRPRCFHWYEWRRKDGE
jgi:hypothetical protein